MRLFRFENRETNYEKCGYCNWETTYLYWLSDTKENARKEIADLGEDGNALCGSCMCDLLVENEYLIININQELKKLKAEFARLTSIVRKKLKTEADKHIKKETTANCDGGTPTGVSHKEQEGKRKFSKIDKEIEILEQIIRQNNEGEWKKIYHNDGFASFIIYRKSGCYVFYSPVTRCYIAKFHYDRLRRFKTEKGLGKFLKSRI